MTDWWKCSGCGAQNHHSYKTCWRCYEPPWLRNWAIVLVLAAAIYFGKELLCSAS